MCGLLKRQVVYYIMCLLNYRTFLQNNTSLVSVIAPSCVGKLWNEMSHISCPIHPNHLLNWLWTSAQLSRFTGYLCICELLHWLCCWTPAVYACVCVYVYVCSPILSSLPACLYVKVCVVLSCVRYETHTQCPSPSSLSVLSTLGEAWAQLKKSLADEAEVHLKFSSKVIHQAFLHL